MTGASRHTLRGVLLAGGIGFILSGPTFVQILGGSVGPFTRSWRMYTGVGRDLCEVRYTQILDDGRSIPIDRREVLRLPRETLWKPLAAQEVRDDARILCERLGPGADLRAAVRCSKPDGWRQAIGTGERLCAP